MKTVEHSPKVVREAWNIAVKAFRSEKQRLATSTEITAFNIIAAAGLTTPYRTAFGD